MSLLQFVSKVQGDIVLNPRFGGLSAVYLRRIEDGEGNPEQEQCCHLTLSPQGNFATSEGAFDTRICVFWAKTADLKFDGKPFLPKEGDVIRYEVMGRERRFRVAPCALADRVKAMFSYEDALHQIIKIHTIREL